ncbi:PHP domain-containing protein [Caldichromatium japonicum]|uniref:PHP domain-containing protein n=1 Tax=Caldichromatium japonicum TaxID=2699430 RepID=A0A6G7VDJ7_9GAMM|nr:PHP domain-containing protein [Caldichromatium japonicum]QIK38143.1 PHP domain-containing protein [Caldichromatium japonicum]
MYQLTDLHTHSTASDGTLTPSQLVVRAHAAGVRVLALTDHDTTDGLAEAGSAAAALGLYLVPGVEISVTWGGITVHLVGLHIDPGNAALQAGLTRLLDFRAWRAEEIGRRLAQHGIAGAYERARTLAQGRLVGRTHFARFLVECGQAPDVQTVFRHFLTRGKPGHVPSDWARLEEAVGWIRAAGGEAVIAHPARYDLTARQLSRLCGEFRELGGLGIEVVSGSHDRDAILRMAQLARAQGLRASAGSDYHGPEQPWLELGRLPPLPAGCVPIWADWPSMATGESPLVCALGC